MCLFKESHNFLNFVGVIRNLCILINEEEAFYLREILFNNPLILYTK